MWDAGFYVEKKTVNFARFLGKLLVDNG